MNAEGTVKGMVFLIYEERLGPAGDLFYLIVSLSSYSAEDPTTKVDNIQALPCLFEVGGFKFNLVLIFEGVLYDTGYTEEVFENQGAHGGFGLGGVLQHLDYGSLQLLQVARHFFTDLLHVGRRSGQLVIEYLVLGYDYPKLLL